MPPLWPPRAVIAADSILGLIVVRTGRAARGRERAITRLLIERVPPGRPASCGWSARSKAGGPAPQAGGADDRSVGIALGALEQPLLGRDRSQLTHDLRGHGAQRARAI